MTPRAGSAGQRMAEGQVDGKTDLLGVKMLLVGEKGPGTPPSPPTRPPSLILQLSWSADADRKQQCSFKGKDPQVS